MDENNILDPSGDWVDQLNKIGDNPNQEKYEFLKTNFRTEGFCLFDKFSYPRYAARFFLYYQTQGIDDLCNFFFIEDIRPKYRTAILETLYFASKKQYSDPGLMLSEKPLLKNPPISDELADYSHKKLFDIISLSIENSDIFDTIISFLNYQRIPKADLDINGIKNEIFSLLRDSTLQINGRVIENFRELVLNDELIEEKYQIFLNKHPVLIDPLAKEIIPKHKLGNDYITDFVIKKLNDEYILVEIEKPRDKIFKQDNDFSMQFIHAIGQVIDFQEWIESNIAYANTKLPNISSPVGIVIMGRSNDMNERQKKKLKRFIINMNNRLKVYTYDDVLENANKLLNNLIMKNH